LERSSTAEIHADVIRGRSTEDLASSRASASERNHRRRRDGTGDAESDLLLQVASGDEEAFSVLLERIGCRVYGVARRVIHDPAQAEEITQEVLLEVWRTAARFDTVRGTAGAWILTVAHRRAVDRVRSEQAERDRTHRIGARHQQRAFDAVADQVILDEEHREVAAALASLTGLQRQAIELAYYQGHTYREVAELLDTSLGTIKTRMRTGLLRLREELEADR